jgi:hypothetical protein
MRVKKLATGLPLYCFEVPRAFFCAIPFHQTQTCYQPCTARTREIFHHALKLEKQSKALRQEMQSVGRQYASAAQNANHVDLDLSTHWYTNMHFDVSGMQES